MSGRPANTFAEPRLYKKKQKKICTDHWLQVLDKGNIGWACVIQNVVIEGDVGGELHLKDDLNNTITGLWGR